MLQRAACPAVSYRDAEKLQLAGWVELLRDPSNFIRSWVEQEGLDTALVVRTMGFARAQPILRTASRARRYCEALQGKGILAKDTHEHTIRIAPPLVITSDQVDWALGQFATTLTQDLS
jgi:acetylornithine/succinyldiaminopimelate/putrescine aminotransferase